MSSGESSSDEDYDKLPDKFTPNQSVLTDLVKCLQAQPDHRGLPPWVHSKLDQLQGRLDFNCHLCYIFAEYQQGSPEARGRAGLKLKSNIIKNPINEIPTYMQEYIKTKVFSCIGAPHPLIRKIVATIISSILYYKGFEGWPTLLRDLMRLLKSTSTNHQLGSLLTLNLICEDHLLDLMEAEGRPLQYFIPQWITLSEHSDTEIRRSALLCLNEIIQDLPPPLMANLKSYVAVLFKNASKEGCSPAIAAVICQSFARLITVCPEHFRNSIERIISFVMSASRSSNHELELRAAEFWPRLASCELAIFAFKSTEAIKPLVMVLLKGMIFDDDDPYLELAEEEGSKPDLPKDLPPQHSDYRAGETYDEDDYEDGDEDEDDYYQQYQDENQANDWTLRNYSAASLDMMAVTLGEPLLKVLLSIITPTLNAQNPKWKFLEASILAIGAVSHGCSRSIAQYLPKLIPFIVKHQKHSHPLVRAISCWTASRYSDWIVQQSNPQSFFVPTLKILLQTLVDSRKVVQSAACHALRTLQDSAKELLIPYLPYILHSYSEAFAKYQKKNTVTLLGTLQRLVDIIGQPLGAQNLREIMMRPLLGRIYKTDDTYVLYPLFSCFTSIAVAIGIDFQPYAKNLYMRAVSVINSTLKLESTDPEHDHFEVKRAKIYCFDLIAGIAEGLGANFKGLMTEPNDMLLKMLVFCMREKEDPQVKQAAFSLAGDLFRSCPEQLRSHLKEMILLLTKGIDPGLTSGLCNNAAWALSEIVLKLGSKMQVFVPEIVKRLCEVITEHSLPQGLLQNCALALGRFALVFPDIVSTAPNIHQFFPRYCDIISAAPTDNEKEQALQGLCLVVGRNPKDVRSFFPHICRAFVSFDALPADLAARMLALIKGFRARAGTEERWQSYFQSQAFTPELRKALLQKFNFS